MSVQERKSSSHDDLWLETIGPRVPAFSLTIPPNPAPDLTYVTVPGAQTGVCMWGVCVRGGGGVSVCVCGGVSVHACVWEGVCVVLCV